MKVIQIPKRGTGKMRTIYVPSPEEKKASASWIKIIEAALAAQHNAHVLHGFRPSRSPVTNALAHVGWRYSLSFDLKDFFDSVKPSHIANLIGSNADLSRCVEACFYDGAARQGLPSSPSIANLAACPLDDAICALIKRNRFGLNFTYTRYADDMTFSFNRPEVGDMLKERIPQLVKIFGFKINPDKTHLQCATAGRRIITGVAVSNTGIHATRHTKRRLRAMRHQLAEGIRPRGRRRLVERMLEAKRSGTVTNFKHLMVNGYHGLKEWAALRLPDGYVPALPTRQKATTQTTMSPGAPNVTRRLAIGIRRLILG